MQSGLVFLAHLKEPTTRYIARPPYRTSPAVGLRIYREIQSFGDWGLSGLRLSAADCISGFCWLCSRYFIGLCPRKSLKIDFRPRAVSLCTPHFQTLATLLIAGVEADRSFPGYRSQKKEIAILRTCNSSPCTHILHGIIAGNT